MAIPAIDLTINSVIVFERERVKVMIAMTHLCFGGDSPLGYVKKYKVFLLFSATTALSSKMIQLKEDYNLEGFFPIYFQNIWLWKSDPLNIFSSVVIPALRDQLLGVTMESIPTVFNEEPYAQQLYAPRSPSAVKSALITCRSRLWNSISFFNWYRGLILY